MIQKRICHIRGLNIYLDLAGSYLAREEMIFFIIIKHLDPSTFKYFNVE